MIQLEKEEVLDVFKKVFKVTRPHKNIYRNNLAIKKGKGFKLYFEFGALLKQYNHSFCAIRSCIAFAWNKQSNCLEIIYLTNPGSMSCKYKDVKLQRVDNSTRISNYLNVVYEKAHIGPLMRDWIYIGGTKTMLICVTKEEKLFINRIVDELQKLIDDKVIQLEQKKQDEIQIKIKEEEKRVADLIIKKDSSLAEFDKDGNGIVDVIEGADDFLTLFKKHQKAIIEIDKDYIQKFVKTSNYLKTKRRNIQSIFENFQQADTHEDLENRVGILKNDIHTYEVLLMHSLNMIMTLVNDDMITFYEIYESFDKLNVFNSNWENEVSGKLSDIGDGLNQLIYSVNKMNQDIVQELSYLSYTTEASFQELQSSVSAELSSINSSIQFGNLLSGIQTYQLHKINKRGDNLLK